MTVRNYFAEEPSSYSLFVTLYHHTTPYHTQLRHLIMVLQKRNANGEFVVWSKDGGTTASAPPPTKKARVEVEKNIPRTPSPPLYQKPTPTSYALPSSASYRPTSAFPMRSYSTSQAGPSSVSAPVPTQRGRKRKANADEPPAEKRLARFKPNCPQATLQRVERMQSQTYVDCISCC